MDGSSTKMEDITRESGKKTKCMDGENSSMRVENWLTKETGRRTSSMVLGRYTTIIPSYSKLLSTTPTLTCSMTIGSIIKDRSSQIPKKVEEKSN